MSKSVEAPSLSKHAIERRDFMQKMVSLFGATTAATVLSGCSVTEAVKFAEQRPHPPKDGKLLSEHESTVLFSLCDCILPKTDTPSASEVGCHQFVPHQLVNCHSELQQKDCVQIINLVEQHANQRFSKSFSLLSIEQQRQLLVDFESSGISTDAQKNQFRFLKALIVFGFFTSEPGATQALNYQPVPGGYVGSIKVGSDTKAWGALDFY